MMRLVSNRRIATLALLLVGCGNPNAPAKDARDSRPAPSTEAQSQHAAPARKATKQPLPLANAVFPDDWEKPGYGPKGSSCGGSVDFEPDEPYSPTSTATRTASRSTHANSTSGPGSNSDAKPIDGSALCVRPPNDGEAPAVLVARAKRLFDECMKTKGAKAVAPVVMDCHWF